MNERTDHPTTDRLNAFVEKTLDAGERAAVDTHLAGCPECRGEVAELRSLFEALSGLAAFSPAAGFADRVMTGVTVRRPAFAGASEWLERFVPATTRGWAAASAVLALPALVAAVLASWLLSQPGVTAQGLWTVTSDLVAEGLTGGVQWAWTRFAGTALATWLVQGLELLRSVGTGELGLAALLFATLTAGSIYVLYQNLFRPIARRTEHASYVF